MSDATQLRVDPVPDCITCACRARLLLQDNFQNCGMNFYHNFMRQFYSRIFSTNPLGVAPLFFMCFGFFEVVQVNLYDTYSAVL